MRVMAKIIGVKHIKRVISIQLNFSFLQIGKSVDTCSPPTTISSAALPWNPAFSNPGTHSERLKQAIYHEKIILN